MRVCIDTNVFVSGIFWKGSPGAVIESWIEERFDLVASVPLLDEYKRVLRKVGVGIDPILAEKWITVLLERVHVIIPALPVKRWSRDRDDDKFIDCALAGNVNYLVSGDQDLLVLNGQFSFAILKPQAFLSLIKTGL